MGKMTFRPADCLVDDVWGKIGTDERDRMEADLKQEVDDYFMREAIKDEKSDSRFDRLLDLERFIVVNHPSMVRISKQITTIYSISKQSEVLLITLQR